MRVNSFTRQAVVATLAVALVTLRPVDATVAGESATGALVTSPNVVFIVTDDQRWDTAWAMPAVQSQLAAEGTTFTNAFASNPECCPSRATILTGDYSHTNGVYSNISASPVGFEAFDDSSTLATWLDAVGYRTGLIGKYLNGYLPRDEYVPPGWDRWFAIRGGFYDYVARDQGTVVEYGTAEQDYSTDVLARKAVEFVRQTPIDRPLFLYFTPSAPHAPATPAPRHQDAFADLVIEKSPSYNEADVSDKPEHIRKLPPLPDGESPLWREQYRSLLAVDEAVNAIVTALERTGRLANTLIVFTSDNGLSWGEHRLRNTKFTPYEESIRVPLVIRYDAIPDAPATVDELVVNVDLAPTVVDATGRTAPTDGISLLPLLAGESTPWRSAFLLEHLVQVAPPYCGVRSTRFTYVKYETGDEELYDLEADPYQETNVATDARYSDVLAGLRTANESLCDPPPPYTRNLP